MSANGDYELPLFPLGTVLFPGTYLPLRIFEPRYVDMIGRCMRDGTGFGVVAIREGRETGSPALPYEIGARGVITDFDRGEDGLLNVVVRGEARFRVSSTRVAADNLVVGRVRDLDNIDDPPMPEAFQTLSNLLADIVKNAELALPGGAELPQGAASVAYTLAYYLPLDLATKVSLLEIEDPIELLKRLSNDVRRLQQGMRKT